MSQLERFEALQARSQIAIGGLRVAEEIMRELKQQIANVQSALVNLSQQYRDFEEMPESIRLAEKLAELEAKREVKLAELDKARTESAALTQLAAACENYLKDKEISARDEMVQRNIESPPADYKPTATQWRWPGPVNAQRL